MAVYLSTCAITGDQEFRAFLNQKEREVEEDQKKELAAACRIQGWWRGVLTRGYLWYLKKCSVVIQRRWRGVLGRRCYRRQLQYAVDTMHFRYYFTAATKIQSCWKGYIVRRDTSNYYNRKHFIEGVTVKGDIFRREALTLREAALATEQQREELEKQNRVDHIAAQHHYMASTEIKAGVYSGPYCSAKAAEIDARMQSITRTLRPSDDWHQQLEQHYFTANGKLQALELGDTDPALKWTGRLGVRSTQEHFDTISTIPILPPIYGADVQGPFRSPGEVQAQRSRPLGLTVQASSEYESMQREKAIEAGAEVKKRMHNTKLKPFSKPHYAPVSFIHCKSPVEKPDYGTVHFRDAATVTSPNKDFQLRSLGRKIPVFDSFNKEYLS